jgi:hypothetical protein
MQLSVVGVISECIVNAILKIIDHDSALCYIARNCDSALCSIVRNFFAQRGVKPPMFMRL